MSMIVKMKMMLMMMMMMMMKKKNLISGNQQALIQSSHLASPRHKTHHSLPQTPNLPIITSCGSENTFPKLKAQSSNDSESFDELPKITFPTWMTCNKSMWSPSK